MYYIGLDVHKKTISFCVKDAAGCVHREGKIGSTRRELDAWIRTLPQPRMMAMEATIFTGWIYDHLLPHAEQVKVAHPLMLRAITAAKRKNDRIDAGKIADCLRCDFLPECHMASTEISAAGRQTATAENDPRRGSDHSTDLGARGGRHFALPFHQTGDQLLRPVQRREELGGQGDADADLEAAQQAYPAGAGGGGQTGAALQRRAGPAPRKGTTTRQRRSGHCQRGPIAVFAPRAMRRLKSR